MQFCNLEMLFMIAYVTNTDFHLMLYMFGKVTFNHSGKAQNGL